MRLLVPLLEFNLNLEVTIKSNRPPINASLALPWLGRTGRRTRHRARLPFLKKCSIDLGVKFLLSIHCRNGVTAGSLQLSPTLSMREQSAQSWSFLALPAAPIERALFAGACSL